MIFKKIIIFFSLLLASYFWTWLNQVNAEMLDYLDWSMKFSQWMVVTFSWTWWNSLWWQANYYTGFVNTMTWKILYIKSVDCKVQNQNTSSWTLQWGFELSPNSWYTSKLLHAWDTQWTWTINYKSFAVNQIFTWSLYYRISEIKTYTTLLRSDNNFLCYINWTYFNNYINLSSTWILDVNIKNSSLNTLVTNTDPIYVTWSFNSSFSWTSYTWVSQDLYNEVFSWSTWSLYFSWVRLFEDINYPALHSNTWNDLKDIKEILYQMLLIVLFVWFFHLTWLFYSFKNDLLWKK